MSRRHGMHVQGVYSVYSESGSSFKHCKKGKRCCTNIQRCTVTALMKMNVRLWLAEEGGRAGRNLDRCEL